MKKHYVFKSSLLIVFGIFLFGCSKNPNADNAQAASKNKNQHLSPEFRSEAGKFLVSAEQLNTMISFGISKEELKNQTAGVFAEFQQLTNIWPAHFLPGAEKDFSSAVRGWVIASSVGESIGKENPLFEELMGYAEHSPSLIRFRVVNDGGSMFFSPGWTGDDYNTRDFTIDNTSNLLTIASSYFERGKPPLNDALQKGNAGLEP